MFPYIVSIIIIDNQQDATILICLFLISSTCFGRCFRPTSGAGWCCLYATHASSNISGQYQRLYL